jgi:hypothetical protein
MLPRDEYEKLDPQTKEFIRYSTLMETNVAVKELKKAIYGNGEEGLCDKVRDSQRGINRLWTMFWFLIASIVGLSVNILANTLKR